MKTCHPFLARSIPGFQFYQCEWVIRMTVHYTLVDYYGR